MVREFLCDSQTLLKGTTHNFRSLVGSWPNVGPILFPGGPAAYLDSLEQKFEKFTTTLLHVHSAPIRLRPDAAATNKISVQKRKESGRGWYNVPRTLLPTPTIKVCVDLDFDVQPT